MTPTTPDPAGGAFTIELKYGNRMYHQRLDLSRVKPTDSPKVTFGYTVQITEKTVAEAKKLARWEKRPVDPAMQVYLAPTRLIPLNGLIDSLKRAIQLPAEPIMAAEGWARKQGATELALNCGNWPERAAAHRFYPRMGFLASSTGYRKQL